MAEPREIMAAAIDESRVETKTSTAGIVRAEDWTDVPSQYWIIPDRAADACLAALTAAGFEVRPVSEREKLTRLQDAIKAVRRRYENPRESHNVTGGFPRGELAWAMYTDLDSIVADLDAGQEP